MANQDKPFGFKLVGNLSGVAQNKVTEYNIESGSTQGIFSGDPVKTSATKNGWDKNLCIFLALATVSLSSSESSSIPSIAIISCNDL